MKQMIVLKNCSCQSDAHEMLCHYRDGLKIKNLQKGDVVNFIRAWHNCYGTFITVEKNGEKYDINPDNLKKINEN